MNIFSRHKFKFFEITFFYGMEKKKQIIIVFWSHDDKHKKIFIEDAGTANTAS